MATTLEQRSRRAAGSPAVASAETAALADRLATALETIACELQRIRVLLDGASEAGAAQHADSGPWLRRGPTAERP